MFLCAYWSVSLTTLKYWKRDKWIRKHVYVYLAPASVVACLQVIFLLPDTLFLREEVP